MTLADDLASHLSTNFDASKKTTGMIFDSLYDRPREATGAAATRYDMVLVEELDDDYQPAGWSHENISRGALVRVWARVLNGEADMKARLDTIVDEARHVLNSQNHLLSGYTYHYAHRVNYHISKEKINTPNREEGYAVLLWTGYKNGRGIT